jgi:hypothetical protein
MAYDSLRKTQDEFIRQARSVHGSRYIYSSSLYQQSDTPVEIGCQIHSVKDSYFKAGGLNLLRIAYFQDALEVLSLWFLSHDSK